MRRLNVALAGFGYAGQTFHAPLIVAAPALNLHTIVSSRPDAVSALWPEVRTVADIQSALDDPAIDLVVIATPNDTHAPLAIRALSAGKAIVIDKPFALDIAEAKALVDQAEAAGLVLSVFQNRRWDADFLAVQALIAEGRLGEIGRFESRFDRFRPEVRDRWRERPGPGAGLWFDLGPHLIDQALVLFGRPLGITADITVQRGDRQGTVDYAHAVLRYDRLRVVLHADMLSAAQPFRFAVHGDRASFVTTGLDPQEDALKGGATPGVPGWGVAPSPGAVTGANGVPADYEGPPGDYLRYYAGIAEAVAGRGPNPVPASEALAVMEILEAGERSSRLCAEVQL